MAAKVKPETKRVVADLTPAEHLKLQRVCLAQRPPVKIQVFVRNAVIRAISPERAA